MSDSVTKEILERIKQDLALQIAPKVDGISSELQGHTDQFSSIQRFIRGVELGATDMTCSPFSITSLFQTIPVACGSSGIRHKIYGLMANVRNQSGSSNATLTIYVGFSSLVNRAFSIDVGRTTERVVSQFLTYGPTVAGASQPVNALMSGNFSGWAQGMVYYRPTKVTEGLI